MEKIPQAQHSHHTKRKNFPAIAAFVLGIFVLALGLFHFLDYAALRDRQLEDRALDIALIGKALISADQIEAAVSTGDNQSLQDSLSEMNGQWDGVFETFIYTLNGSEPVWLAGFDSALPPDYTEQVVQAIQDKEPLVMKPSAGSEEGGVLAALGGTEGGTTPAVLGIRFSYGWDGDLVSKAVFAGMFVLLSELLIAAIYRLHKKNCRIAGTSAEMRHRESVFKSLINSLPMGVAIGHAGERNFITANKQFADILGIEQSDLTQMTIDELLKAGAQQTPDQQDALCQQDAISGYSMVKQVSKPDGQSVWINMYVASMNQGVNDENHLCIIEDVTQRTLMETALRESERSKAVILAHLPGMAYRCRCDREWTMLFVSEGCEKLTGYAPESLLYNEEISFNDLIVTEYREGLWREWERILALNIPFQGEYEIVTKNGVRKWVMEMGQGIYDNEGNVVALEGLIIDMTAKKLSEAQIKHMSDHDLLTGLYNRKYFEEEKTRIRDAGRFPVSIIMSNISGVRLINDAFGYTEGDRVIIEAASIMKRRCREADILARTGGDEFSLLLPGTDARQVSEILQNIYAACDQYNMINPNRRYDISLTLGCGTANPGEAVGKAAKDAEESLHNNKLLNRKSSHSTILSSVMATMFERSQETEEHAERLGQLSKSIGEMLNLPQKNLVELELFSMLHDIGKVGIDDHILNKPGKLTEEEWAVMKKHPEIGYRIAMSSPELEPIAEYILSHHERWDGKGYPLGLKGENIPLLARILAVADAYDAMTEDRVYRKALTKQDALGEIERNAGTQFDPFIAQKFIQSMK